MPDVCRVYLPLFYCALFSCPSYTGSETIDETSSSTRPDPTSEPTQLSRPTKDVPGHSAPLPWLTRQQTAECDAPLPFTDTTHPDSGLLWRWRSADGVLRGIRHLRRSPSPEPSGDVNEVNQTNGMTPTSSPTSYMVPLGASHCVITRSVISTSDVICSEDDRSATNRSATDWRAAYRPHRSDLPAAAVRPMRQLASERFKGERNMTDAEWET